MDQNHSLSTLYLWQLLWRRRESSSRRPPSRHDHADQRVDSGMLVTDGGRQPTDDPKDAAASPDGGVLTKDSETDSPPNESDSDDESDDESEIQEEDRIDPAVLARHLQAGRQAAAECQQVLGERTVNVQPDLDEDAFFTGIDGIPTVVSRYDLEKAVPLSKKRHFQEVERYWVNKPYAFVIVFHSERENEKKYYVIEPSLTETEESLRDFLTEKLTDAITYSWQRRRDDSAGMRTKVIEEETYNLLSRYNIYSPPRETGDGFLAGLELDFDEVVSSLKRVFGLTDSSPGTPGDGEDLEVDTASESESDGGSESEVARDALRIYPSLETLGRLDGAGVRPASAVLADGETTISEYQVEKLLYYLRRDFIGFERIDPMKHDVNVEDISCDGYRSPVFVYHTDYEQLISNVAHGESDLDDFVVKLAQRSGKGISKRQPQVDATLPDGSRAQLTLGKEVSGRGTNYTIRQFKDVPFTPVDLINWHTFSLEQIALLWLCIENNMSIMFAGGTASGKTTSLNALSLFIPSTAKIVSIEDTREVELPQRNWVASVTRPSFSEDEKGDVDEFDLLEAALRQRPDYLVMGEVRGEEGRTLFQMMSTGHTTYTTFHADSVGEVIDRFTTDPINVSKSLFTALDLISIQIQTRVQGRKVRRNKTLTEINRYDAELDEINVQDVYKWHPAQDAFKQLVDPSVLEEVKFDRGWDEDRLQDELFKRKVLLAYLVKHHINTYAEVAAAIQGFISDPETILGLLAQDRLDETLADLRSMESVLIDINPEKEAMVPRPDPTEPVRENAQDVLSEASDELFEEYAAADVADTDIVATLQEAADFDWNTEGGRPTAGNGATLSGEPLGTAWTTDSQDQGDDHTELEEDVAVSGLDGDDDSSQDDGDTAASGGDSRDHDADADSDMDAAGSSDDDGSGGRNEAVEDEE